MTSVLSLAARSLQFCYPQDRLSVLYTHFSAYAQTDPAFADRVTDLDLYTDFWPLYCRTVDALARATYGDEISSLFDESVRELAATDLAFKVMRLLMERDDASS